MDHNDQLRSIAWCTEPSLAKKHPEWSFAAAGPLVDPTFITCCCQIYINSKHDTERIFDAAKGRARVCFVAHV
eukprot:6251602-Amphidinium_carterae.1